MSEAFEDDSIESIAAGRWGEYSGDVSAMKLIEASELSMSTQELLRLTLRDNFVEGFRQGVLLRLTGGNDDGIKG